MNVAGELVTKPYLELWHNICRSSVERLHLQEQYQNKVITILAGNLLKQVLCQIKPDKKL